MSAEPSALLRTASRHGLAALLVNLAIAPAAVAGETRFALIAGANRGLDNDLPLRYAEHDAERMAEVLENLGNVAPANVVLLKDASAPRMRSVFESLSTRIAAANQRGDDTLVYVYYSGHADAGGLRMEETHFPLDELKERVEGLPAKVRLLVVDACQSGEILRGKGAVQIDPFPIRPERLSSEGLAVITSSAAGEDAQESERLHGGVFTHHFVAGLTGAADTSSNGKVTLTEAFDYAANQTVRTTSRAQVVQHPLLAQELTGHSDLVLTILEDRSRTGILELEEPGDYLVFNERNERELVLEFAAKGSTKVNLSPGSYLVRRRGMHDVREATVDVSRGDVTLLADNEMSTMAYGETVRKGLATDRRVAVAVTASGGVTGPSVPDTRPAPIGTVGLRLDFSKLTSGLKLSYSANTGSNQVLDFRHERFGVDLYAMPFFDFGHVALGMGGHGGYEFGRQTFETSGIAPDRLYSAGRVGFISALDIPVAPRWTLSLWGGVDALLYSELDPVDETSGFRARVLPHASIEIAAYVF